MPEILKPLFHIEKIPIWGFNMKIVNSIFKKSFELISASKEIDEDGYGPFLVLLFKKKQTTKSLKLKRKNSGHLLRGQVEIEK